ncbi:2-octaprenylphenol hydroxylase [Salsuginibacillus halophilus]|uniref:2-octaprenylphenol hydroxylase n=1 Tax=Salsuginibacillus halophilus TaxID=517424 RepID=A0A2P8HWF2_9BACI|nr:AarF/ABC1/UbiB kinase family protein [Salsuginibacillus halophilus]PSL50547.1 2-octaprenylphenol hydroxylase [Salsuginibacillus halophilus]
MKITKGFRHANHYRKIATVLARHGFGYILKEVGLFHVLSLPKRIATDPTEFDNRSVGTRIRNAMEELGPTFIKLGQMISTRKDVFPPSIVREIEKLQDDVAPFSFEKAKAMIEEDLESPLEKLFSRFDEEPLAAASIGQVHYAELHDGTKAAVKIARPNIKEIIEKDIEVLRDLARLLTQRFHWAQYYKLEGMVEEFAEAIRAEADYDTEWRNTDKLQKNMEKFRNIHVPDVYETYSSRRILTMEMVEGEKFSSLHKLDFNLNRKKLARSLADAFLHQVLIDGFFHSDPHPGNIFITGPEEAAFIDCGQIGRLNQEMQRQFVDYVIALTRRDPEAIAKAIYNMAEIPKDMDEDRFADDVEHLLFKYYNRPFKEIRLGEAINDIFSTAHRYQIFIYKEYTLLAKAIITMESVCAQLDPELSIVEVAEPYGKELAKQRLKPQFWMSEIQEELKAQQQVMRDIPTEFRDALKRLNESHVGVEMKIPKIDIFLNKLDRISNRISFSITLLAFSIIMVGLIIGSSFGAPSSFLVNLPVIEISFVVAFFMFLWLFFAIFKSGRF